MAAKTPLSRNRKEKPSDARERDMVDKGLDTNPDLYDKLSKRTRDFSVPLNEYYHARLVQITEEMQAQHGVPVKRRPLAAQALKDFIDRKSEELGIN